MITITGIIEDATGANLHATLHFISQSTPLVGAGVVTTNSDIIVKSNAADGTFAVPLAAGNYQVLVSANGKTSSFIISVPSGTATASIESLVSSPLVYTYSAPAALWNGIWSGSVQFMAIPAPAAPAFSEISYAGGSVENGAAHYTYWVSYLTPGGETNVSPALNVSLTSGSPQANRALQLSWSIPTPSGVTAIRIWRTRVDDGSAYKPDLFPANVSLLATLPASAGSYVDFESAAQFAARATSELPPLYNTTAGQFLDSAGGAMACFAESAVCFPGSNVRIKRNIGLQLFNYDTGLWHTLGVSGNPPQIGLDSGSHN